MTSQVLWYLTRGTGMVALILLTATVVLGIAGTARAASPGWPRIVTAGLHRNLALIAVAFVAAHVITTVLDPFVSIGLTAAFVPFSADYRPFWQSLGTIAFDLLLVVVLSSLLRDRLSRRAWRSVHLLVYACWPVALWHGLGTGTDARLSWVLAIDAGCVIAVAGAACWRLRLTASRPVRRAGFAAVSLAVSLTLLFVLAGPLQPGWARRAGTPPSLVGLAPSRGAGKIGAMR
jgi:sulfoxide reductase heme-binding subunit YedZ